MMGLFLISSFEKRVKTSGRPSRYQIGDRRYIGGQIRWAKLAQPPR